MTFIPLFLYLLLYLKARKLKNASVAPESTVTAVNDEQTFEVNKRANFTFFIMFLSLFFVIVPPIFINVIIGQVFTPSLWSEILRTISINALPLLVILDPIVISRDRDVREVFCLPLKNFKKYCWNNITKCVNEV